MGDKQVMDGAGLNQVREGAGIKCTGKSTHDTQKGEGTTLLCRCSRSHYGQRFCLGKIQCRERRQDNQLISQETTKHNRNCHCHHPRQMKKSILNFF